MDDFAAVDPFRMFLAGVAGVALAWLHLTALSRSLRRFAAGARGESFLLGSGLARVALVTAGFGVIGGADPILLVPSLLGFLLARTLLMRRFSNARVAPAFERRES